jgi:hypothetical protein
MLRITMSVSGEGAAKYFDAALATSKYYGSERGQWGGKGAEVLGLRGNVSHKDFISLASNKRPGTDETLTARMKTTRRQKELVFEEKANTWKLEDEEVSNRRAGYDFCFSVPKSVSLYLVETGDRTVERRIRLRKRWSTSRTVWRRGYAEKEKTTRHAMRSGPRET